MGDIVPESDFRLKDRQSEIRKDPILNRWTIIAPDRAKRGMAPDGTLPVCPFCSGNESQTLEELDASRTAGSKPNDPNWLVRAIPNLYPAVRMEGDLLQESDGLYEQYSGIGFHEVIVECPQHETSLANLSASHLTDLLTVWKNRLLFHRKDPRIKYAKIFKNQGTPAGASLEHCHSQLVALPRVPGIIDEEWVASKRYYQQHLRCVFCHLIDQEQKLKTRLVDESDRFIVFAAYAARFPFETWLLPKHHQSHFEDVSSEELKELGQVYFNFLKRLQIGLKDPPYNVVLHNSPLDVEESLFYHWHLEIIPRITQAAGFEWGTGWNMNPVPPEQASSFLKTISW